MADVVNGPNQELGREKLWGPNERSWDCKNLFPQPVNLVSLNFFPTEKKDGRVIVRPVALAAQESFWNWFN